MFDLSSEFKRFYRECVVLPETKQAELRASRKKNIKRFKSGLVEYNKLNQTDSYNVHCKAQSDNLSLPIRYGSIKSQKSSKDKDLFHGRFCHS